MSNHRFETKRGRLACIALTAIFVFAAVPVVAQASAVNLATAGPFVVLGGSTVTNTGPSVLEGDLGVSPGTSLVGFGLPAVVKGATHANNAVAANAQSDLTTAYEVAAGQPVPLGNELTGTNLGSRTLGPGAYSYATSAQLTGALTLDAAGDPSAQFVFEIGSTLTTASASSVLLTNGASPCNVYWQVGSSATLDTGTAFQGNLMALTDITLNKGASVIGRVLARNGQIEMNDNVLSNGKCAAGSATTPTGSTPSGSDGTPSIGTAQTAVPPRSRAADKDKDRSKGTATLRHGKRGGSGISVSVRGHRIQNVVFTVDGKKVGGGAGSPNQVMVPVVPGKHEVVAHVIFEDATHAKTMRFRYRIPPPLLQPRRGPSQFTG